MEMPAYANIEFKKGAPWQKIQSVRHQILKAGGERGLALKHCFDIYLNTSHSELSFACTGAADAEKAMAAWFQTQQWDGVITVVAGYSESPFGTANSLSQIPCRIEIETLPPCI